MAWLGMTYFEGGVWVRERDHISTKTGRRKREVNGQLVRWFNGMGRDGTGRRSMGDMEVDFRFFLATDFCKLEGVLGIPIYYSVFDRIEAAS